MISASTLALGLAERLDTVVPDGFAVTVRRSNLYISGQEHGMEVAIAEILEISDREQFRPVEIKDKSWADSGVSVELPADDSDEAFRLEATVQSALSSIQDFIMRATTEIWPTSPHTQTQSVPMPGVKVGKVLELWYGPYDCPVLKFIPIAYD